MQKFMDLLERYLLPIAEKLASQRHLSATKDAFIAILPITLVGSIAVLLNVIFRDIPNSLSTSKHLSSSMQDFFAKIPTTFDWLIQIDGAVWWGTLALMALVFAFTLGYNLAKKSDVNPLPAAVVAVAVLFVTIPQLVPLPEGTVDSAGAAMTSVWAVSPGYLGAGGLFTSLIMVLIMMEVYVLLMKKKITIKLPSSVPSNVSGAFTAIIPGAVAVFGSAIIAYVVFQVTDASINDFIAKTIMDPLLNLSQGYLSVMLITLLTQLFWFFGIHGMMVLTPIYEAIWGVAQVANVDAFMKGAEHIPYMWTRLSFDLYGTFGGSGATLGLVIGMFFFGRRSETKQLRNLAAPAAVFNINEPLSFGMPIVLNPIYFLPWVFVPMITMTIGYIATSIGFAGPVVAAIPWVTPVGLSALLATGGNIGAMVTQLVCLVVSIVIWIPFLIIGERQADKLYGKEDVAQEAPVEQA